MYFKQIPSIAIGWKQLTGHIYLGCRTTSLHHHSYTVYWTAICDNEIHHFVRHILGLLTLLRFWEISDGMKYSLCNGRLYFCERCTIFCMQLTGNTALFILWLNHSFFAAATCTERAGEYRCLCQEGISSGFSGGCWRLFWMYSHKISWIISEVHIQRYYWSSWCSTECSSVCPGTVFWTPAGKL